MVERSNTSWITALSQPGPQRDAALADLRALLVRGLGYAMAGRPNVRQEDIEDFAQDALVKILAALDSFRGESRFTTWAQKIAVHVALTELRRRRWRDVSLQKLSGFAEGDLSPDAGEHVRLVDPAAKPEQQVLQRQILDTMRHVIAEELTERQRQALVAVRIQGMPLAEVARRMDTNRNALYKLLHDARQRLKRGMMDRGLSPQDVLAAFGS